MERHEALHRHSGLQPEPAELTGLIPLLKPPGQALPDSTVVFVGNRTNVRGAVRLAEYGDLLGELGGAASRG